MRLKNRKITISRPRFRRFWQNLVWLHSLTLLSVANVKNFIFWKSKMAAAAIMKNRKIAISRPRFERFLLNLAHWCIYHNLPLYWYCFRGRVRLGGKGRFWCAACKSVNRTCSTSTLFMSCMWWLQSQQSRRLCARIVELCWLQVSCHLNVTHKHVSTACL